MPFIFNLPLIWLLVAGPSGTTATDEQRIARDVDAYVKPLTGAGGLSGTLLVARDGRVIFERSYGFVDLDRKTPLRPDTRLGIASITKPITVALAMSLVAEGKLRLEDTLSRWIPEFPRASEITVDHLMRHRAGIPHRVTDREEETRPTSAADMVKFAARRPLEFTPGERSNYSSAGYSVLARVLELAGGKSYGELLQERVFRPLHMDRSTHPDQGFPVATRPPSFLPGVKGSEPATFQDLSFLVGAGSVYSTAHDVSRFLHAVVSGELGAETRARLVRGGAVHWNGSTSGFRAFADWDSSTGIAVAFSGNSQSGANDLVRQNVPKIAAGESVEPASIPRPVTAQVSETLLGTYEGIYRVGGGPLKLVARNGSLWLGSATPPDRKPTGNDWILVPTSDSTFFSPRDYAEIRIMPGADGKVDRLEWRAGGQTFLNPRLGDLEPKAN